MRDAFSDEVAGWFENPRARHDGVMVRCPAHEDDQQSLHVSLGRDGRALLKCFAGCKNSEILERVGKEFRNLFPRDRWSSVVGAGREQYVLVTYDYRDLDGSLVYQAVRKQFADRKEFFQRKPKPGGGYDYKLNGVPRVLYRLTELRAAIQRGEPISVVEGEKDVDALRSRGIVGTTNVGGAGNWRDEYGAELAGANVVLIPDNDLAGYRHMQEVAQSLEPYARWIRVIRLIDFPEKSDISDYLELVDEAGVTALRSMMRGEINAAPMLQLVPLSELHRLARPAETGASVEDESANSSTSSSSPPPWPVLHPESMHGLAGDIVRLFEPHTEADPAALLVTTLVMLGNCLGREPHVYVGETRHGVNAFAAIVGKTSRSRKGTSAAGINRILEKVDKAWRTNRQIGGLGSGEGVIMAIRDPSEKPGGDPGVEDKRVLVFEEELSLIFNVGNRDGNSLSEVLRRAWDSPLVLHNTVKINPMKATKPHVSVLGHTTDDELRRTLTAKDRANGTGNRFIWVLVKRSKHIAIPERLDESAIQPLTDRIFAVKAFASQERTTTFSPEAKQLWRLIYLSLTADYPGMFGALVARAEAQVVRFSLLYAVLDRSETIEPVHIRAALALWHLCEMSTRQIFGDRTGNPDADRIIDALEDSEDGLTETELYDVFANNIKKPRLHAALGILTDAGIAEVEEVPRDGTKPARRWFLPGKRSENRTPDYLQIAREFCTKYEFHEFHEETATPDDATSSNSYFVTNTNGLQKAAAEPVSAPAVGGRERF